MTTDVVRVAVAGENAMTRLGLRTLLGSQPDMQVVGEAQEGRQAVEMVRASRPDVLVLDLRRPAPDRLAALPSLALLTRVVVLTHDDGPNTVVATLCAGACGYLAHGHFRSEDLCRAVRAARMGGSVLSPGAAAVVVDRLRHERAHQPSRQTRQLLSRREAEVMDLVARGASNREVAGLLFVTEKTTKNHLTRIYAKLGASSRAHAVSRWLGADAPGPAMVPLAV